MNLSTITATAEHLPNGKTRYTVFYNGEIVDSRTSKIADYAVIHIQRWLPVDCDVAPENPVANWREYAAEDKFAARYSRKPKAAGSPIEYGYCAGNVEIRHF
jgi:hypothetical protein